MKRGRPSDPLSVYRVSLHVNNGYVYAVTRPYTLDECTQKKKQRYIQWGRVNGETKTFIPNARFTELSPEERERFIFPDDWDLSEVQNLSSAEKQSGRAYVEADRDRLYGDVWLLEQIAEKLGIWRDLVKAVNGNKEKAADILSLAMFLFLTKEPLSHMAQWQEIAKFPAGRPLKPPAITRLTQSITEQERMQMFSALRQGAGSGKLCAVDSTSRSGYGTTLSDLAYGKSKDHLDHLKQTTEVVVYSLENHIPLFYHTFPGNIPDSRSLRVILTYLQHAGFRDLVLITDRGYECRRNLQQCVLRRQSIVTAASVYQKMILRRIRAIEDVGRHPSGMEWLAGEQVFAEQFDEELVVLGRGGKYIPSNRLRVNLYLSPMQRTIQLMAMEDKLQEQERQLSELRHSGTALSNSERRRYNMFKVVRTETNAVDSFERDEDKISRHEECFGFFAIMTLAVNWSAQETLRNYHLRDE